MRREGAFSVRDRGLHSWEWSRMAKAKVGPGSKVPYGGGGGGVVGSDPRAPEGSKSQEGNSRG